MKNKSPLLLNPEEKYVFDTNLLRRIDALERRIDALEEREYVYNSRI